MTRLLTTAIFISFFVYLIFLGATFNAVLIPDFQQISLVALTVLIGGWLLLRWRQGWAWHPSPLDAVFLLWAGVFALSILANPATWRRSVEGLWYMGLYAGLWWCLVDLLANCTLPRQTISAALLIAGLFVIVFGYMQSFNTQGVPLAEIRPGSTLGNPNALGAFLAMLLPFAAVQVVQAPSRSVRIVMAGYLLLVLGLLGLSFSRAGWLGGAAAGLSVVALLLADRGLLPQQDLRTWWQGLSSRGRMRVWLLLGLAMLIALAIGVLLVESLSLRGRQLVYRTYLWDAAWQLFTQKPLTGHGFFTFGYHVFLFEGVPPIQPQSHAHSIPLTVLAEMGLAGAAALVVSVGVVLRQLRRNWTALIDDRPTLIAGIAALAGFGAQHLMDTPAMMPAIALTALLMLALCLTPAQPQPVRGIGRRAWPISVTIGWAALLALAFWSSGLYSAYYHTLVKAQETDDYIGGAEQLAPVIAADPAQPAYHMMQGYLYGLAAAEGDLAAAELAQASYRRYLALEPNHAVSWANLAALAYQTSDDAAALQAIDQAIRLAPAWPLFQRQQAIYRGDLTDAADMLPEEAELPDENMARFQLLRDVYPEEYLPQVGWGSRPD